MSHGLRITEQATAQQFVSAFLTQEEQANAKQSATSAVKLVSRGITSKLGNNLGTNIDEYRAKP
jgi:hypothetical protein